MTVHRTRKKREAKSSSYLVLDSRKGFKSAARCIITSKARRLEQRQKCVGQSSKLLVAAFLFEAGQVRVKEQKSWNVYFRIQKVQSLDDPKLSYLISFAILLRKVSLFVIHFRYEKMNFLQFWNFSKRKFFIFFCFRIALSRFNAICKKLLLENKNKI